MAKLKAPVMLTILDGFGIGDVNDPTNAIVQAKPENFLKLWETYPHTQLQASGLAVVYRKDKWEIPKSVI